MGISGNAVLMKHPQVSLMAKRQRAKNRFEEYGSTMKLIRFNPDNSEILLESYASESNPKYLGWFHESEVDIIHVYIEIE